MVKTLCISDENHKEMLKIQGQIQAKSGEFTSMDDVMSESAKSFRKKKLMNCGMRKLLKKPKMQLSQLDL